MEFGVGFKTNDGPKRDVRVGAGLRRVGVVLYALFALLVFVYSGAWISDTYSCRLDGLPRGGVRPGDTLVLGIFGLEAQRNVDKAGEAMGFYRIPTQAELREAIRASAAGCAKARHDVWASAAAVDAGVLASVYVLGLLVAAVVRWVYRGFKATPPPLDRPA